MGVIDLIGLRFGRLLVIERGLSTGGNRGARWVCLCDCGGVKTVRSDALKGGITRSCGCLISETATSFHTKHGHSKVGNVSRTYSSWQSMKDRVLNPRFKQHKDYSGRGITICDEWANSFSSFLKDMGVRPDGKELDRINNDLGYFKENCRWATHKENMNNRRVSLKNRKGDQ